MLEDKSRTLTPEEQASIDKYKMKKTFRIDAVTESTALKLNNHNVKKQFIRTESILKKRNMRDSLIAMANEIAANQNNLSKNEMVYEFHATGSDNVSELRRHSITVELLSIFGFINITDTKSIKLDDIATFLTSSMNVNNINNIFRGFGLLPKFSVNVIKLIPNTPVEKQPHVMDMIKRLFRYSNMITNKMYGCKFRKQKNVYRWIKSDIYEVKHVSPDCNNFINGSTSKYDIQEIRYKPTIYVNW